MKTVILDVRAPADSMADFVRVWKTGKAEKTARISFATPELLWQVLTAKRWELLRALCGAGPMTQQCRHLEPLVRGDLIPRNLRLGSPDVCPLVGH